MSDDERIRALIVALADWRDELAEVEKSLSNKGLTREQRLLLEGDKVASGRRVHRATTIISNYDILGMTSDGRAFFAQQVGESKST